MDDKFFQAVEAEEAKAAVLHRPPVPPDIRIWYGDDIVQFGDWRRPEGEGPFPLAIILHGGYWKNKYNLDHSTHVADAYRKAGIATWALEFRRVGDKGGAYPGTFFDIADGIEFIRSEKFRQMSNNCIDYDNVIIIGHSAGGHLGVWMAGRDKIPENDPLWRAEWKKSSLKLKGVVSLAGVHNLEYCSQKGLGYGAADGLMNGTVTEKTKEYYYASPINVAPIDTPIIMIHGTEDMAVPVALSDQYMEAAKGSPHVKFIRIEGGDHFDMIDPERENWHRYVKKAVLDLVSTKR